MKRLFILLTTATLLLMTSGHVFAQGGECPTCSAAPTDLQKYITTMAKLIAIIPVGSQAQAGSGSVPIGVTASATQAQAAELYNDILYGGAGQGNMFEDIELLLRGGVTAREAIALQALDKQLVKRVFLSYKAGRINDPLGAGAYVAIDQTFKELEYVQLAKNNVGYVIEQSVPTYKDYAELLRRYNKIYKTLHNEERYRLHLKEINSGYDIIHADNPDDVKEHPQKEQLSIATQKLDALIRFYLTPLTEGRSGKGTDRLEFAETKKVKDFFLDIRAIHDEYVCATRTINSCEEQRGSWKKAANESRSYVKEVWKVRGGSAIQTFKDARSDLKDALKKGSDKDKEGSQQRANFQETSQYGQDLEDDKKWRDHPGGLDDPFAIDAYVDPMPIGIQAFKNILVKSYETAAKTLGYEKTPPQEQPSADQDTAKKGDGETSENRADTEEKRKQLLSDYAQHLEDSKDTVWLEEDPYLGELRRLQAKQDRIASFTTTFDSVLDLQEQFEQQAILIDTNVITKRMPLLSAAMHKNMATWGDKNSPGGIYNSMGQICEIQCENVGGKCWYEGK